MIVQETRIENNKSGKETPVTGYFLTIKDLTKLSKDFHIDNCYGYIDNDVSYVEKWLKKHTRI
jgi:hypothetical protein